MKTENCESAKCSRYSCSPNRVVHLSCNEISTNSIPELCNRCSKERKERFCVTALPCTVSRWVGLFLCAPKSSSSSLLTLFLTLVMFACCGRDYFSNRLFVSVVFSVLLSPSGSCRWMQPKVQVVKTHNSGRALQCFLGFAYFHGDFVAGFRPLAAPLNALNSYDICLSLSPAA